MANRYVLSCALKACTESASLTYDGKLFQSLGATTAKSINLMHPCWIEELNSMCIFNVYYA